MGSAHSQLFCQAQLGVELGQEVIDLVESVSGQPCPCKRGLVCPLAPPEAEALAAPPIAG